MSYLELKYYKSYALEVREYGATGWAVHIYRPEGARPGGKIAVLHTLLSAELDGLLQQAQAFVDTDFEPSAS